MHWLLGYVGLVQSFFFLIIFIEEYRIDPRLVEYIFHSMIHEWLANDPDHGLHKSTQELNDFSRADKNHQHLLDIIKVISTSN